MRGENAVHTPFVGKERKVLRSNGIRNPFSTMSSSSSLSSRRTSVTRHAFVVTLVALSALASLASCQEESDNEEFMRRREEQMQKLNEGRERGAHSVRREGKEGSSIERNKESFFHHVVVVVAVVEEDERYKARLCRNARRVERACELGFVPGRE
mmetsp:Transcript_2978/g.8062  ORF Transcript_2978/g.8062 Transcript_2978/m.8062 type:complete len:155 (-) Transcript_2978:54-518(-)